MSNPWSFIKSWTTKHSNSSSEVDYVTSTDVTVSPGAIVKRGLDFYLVGAQDIAFKSGETGVLYQENGTASTTAGNIPAISEQAIKSIIIKNTNASDVNLQASWDNGSTYFDIEYGDTLSMTFDATETQVKLKANTSTCSFQIIMEREIPP